MKYLRLILATAAIMLAAVACNHEDRLGGGSSHGSSNNNGGGQQTTGGMPQTYKNRSDWSVSYMGRDDDAKMGRVECIDINVPGAKWFVIRTITPDDFSEFYASKVADFIEDEISGLRDIAAEERQAVTNYCEQPDGLMTYSFPWMFSGDMMTFVIGMTDQGWPSGDYALAQYTIEPDPEDEYYPKWLGNWIITNSMVGYKIVVSRAEPNLAYYIRGWETGDSISESTGTQMDEVYENLFTYYNSDTHNMDFVSLYFTTYKDDNLGDVDEYFIGRIKDKDNEWWDVLSEDEVIAIAKLDGDDKANVTGANIKTKLDEVAYNGPYTKMQYVCVDTEGKIYLYNDNVPSFPLTMTKTVEEPQPVSMRGVRRTRSARPNVVRNHPVGSTSLAARSTPKCSPSGKR